MFDWILFDADHTLFDFDRSAEASLHELLREAGVEHRPDHFSTYIEINKRCWSAFERGEIDRPTLIRKRFLEFFEACEISGLDPEQSNSRYLGRLPQFPYFNAGAPGILENLQHRFRLGLITNGLKEVQRPRLHSSGIHDYFEVIVVSGEIGYVKPDRAFFAYTHDQMQQPEKKRVLVVGDNLNADIGGGKAFGYRTCWFNPDGNEGHPDIESDYEVRSLAEVELLLARD